MNQRPSFHLSLWLWPLLLIALLMPQTAARGQNAVSLWVKWVDSSAFPMVHVYLGIWNDRGVPVRDLRPEHFQIREDAGPPIRPLKVEANTQAPLHVVLVLDVSESMRGRPLADAKAAAARFLDRLGPQDQAALVAFSSPVDPNPDHLDGVRELDFRSDLTPLYEAIENLRSGGGTALYHAVQKAVGLAAGQPPGHRAVLLLTDGRNDPPEVGDPEAAIALAQQARVPVFVIGLGQEIDTEYLRRLAEETGGLFRQAPSSAELARLFNEMATLLKTQYRLTYRSALPADGATHTLTVTVHTLQGAVAVAPNIPFGPVPRRASTATPTDTAEPAATPTPMTRAAVRSLPRPTPKPTSIPPTTTTAGMPPAALATIAGLLLSGAAFIVVWRRRRPQPEFCAQCGYDLTGHTGPCPVCGHTQRLQKPKDITP